MPLADDRRLVARSLEQLGKRWLRAVKLKTVVNDAVQVAVLAGEDDGTARGTDRVRHEGVTEQHSFVGQAIEVRGRIDHRPIGADGVRGVIVCEHKQDVGWFRRG